MNKKIEKWIVVSVIGLVIIFSFAAISPQLYVYSISILGAFKLTDILWDVYDKVFKK